MMTLLEYPLCIRESLAVYNLLRELGFSPDEIFFNIDTKENPKYIRTNMVVCTAGREFSVATGWAKQDILDQILNQWQEAAEYWNTTNETERASIIACSRTYTDVINTRNFIDNLKKNKFIPDNGDYPC